MSISLLWHHWQPSWTVLVPAAFCAGVYLAATLRVKAGWPLRRTLSFLAGIACVVVALQSGIGAYDDRLLSVHMVQHMLLLLAAPLLLLCGQPVLLALRALPRDQRGALARALKRTGPLTGPVQCLALFSLVVLLTHLPSFYSATLRHPVLHDAEHLAYLAAGLLMWWPLLGADPLAARRLGGLGRLVYLLAAMPAMAFIGVWLNRATALAYPAYGPPARALHVSALADQAQAGAIMWVAGSTFLVAVGLWVVIAALIDEEARQTAQDTRGLSFKRTDASLNRRAPTAMERRT